MEIGKNYVKSFKSKDVNDLRKELEQCLENDPPIDTRQYIIDNYSWEKVVKTTLERYSALLR